MGSFYLISYLESRNEVARDEVRVARNKKTGTALAANNAKGANIFCY